MSEIIGLLFAVVLAAAMIPGLANFTQRANDNTRAATTAEQHKQFIEASSQYIKQYSTNLAGQATATTPAVVTVPMLKTVKLLDAGFNAVNPFGQTWQTQVLQPSAGNLQALILSYGGTAMDDKTASKIAGLVGQAGGLIPKNDSGIYPGAAANAFGSFSGWQVPTANYSSISGGHLAALVGFNNGQLTSNYLYRNAVPGQPQLNRMGTDLDLSNNNLNNVATINTNLANATNIKSTRIDTATLDATGAITSQSRVTAAEYVQVKGTVVEGTACPSNDLLARDASGLILSCQSGIWKKNQMIDKPIIRYGDWGNIPSAALEPDSSVAYCESDEIVIGGGGTCSSPEYAWIHDSKPIFRGDTLSETTVAINDGWYANCFGRSPNSWVIDRDYPAKSYAICLKK
jgi:hypothetical protein